MEWKVLSKEEAAHIVDGWQLMSSEDFKKMISGWSDILESEIEPEYKELRKSVSFVFEQCKNKIENEPVFRNKKDYYFDLLFGLELYKILEKYGFGIRMASNDQVWIHLCVKIFPDIVSYRYPGDKKQENQDTSQKNANAERFYKTRRRIYLKVLWWYVYLSLVEKEDGNPDYEQTYSILKNNSTDEIVQTVERSGKLGYRVSVYREIMKYYAAHRDIYDNKKFRKIMVLNTARTQLIEPELMSGGVKAYTEELFKYFEGK